MQITTNKLRKIKLEGGDVFHGLKESDSCFDKFGELYFSWIKPGSIKAWKKHRSMTANLIVPHGMVKFVFCKDIQKRSFQEVIIGNSIDDESKYSRITMSPGIWFGFQGLTTHNSLVVNIANIEHSSEEVEALDINSLQYDW